MASEKSLSGETETNTPKSVIQRKSPEPSCMSIKSDQSLRIPPNFSDTYYPDNGRNKMDEPKLESNSTQQEQLESIFQNLEHKIIALMKKELEMFKRVLSLDNPSRFEREEEDEGQNKVRDGLLKITLNVLKKMNQTDLALTLQTRFAPFYLKQHKSSLNKKFQIINEGISSQGNSVSLHEIYTELYITEGGSGEVNNEHEVRQIETVCRRPERQGTSIKCNDIFRTSLGQKSPTRTVLTKGVAGIGKTVSVQKFILDWTEGKANQDFHFIFPLPFRELNLIKQRNLSLMELLCNFFTHINELASTDVDNFKILFIFDGLDECRLSLDFLNNPSLSDVTKSAPVDVLLTNLIKGNLLPSALLWITSRPAAASQIPPECVDLVTDVRGFNDPQKDEYFRKKVNDLCLASKIIRHIKSSRSLYIMCHIPVFCWISATVLQTMMGNADNTEIPKTLTQMFIHFLIFQTKLKSLKYDGKCDADLKQARNSILSLGNLAFQQLEKGNLIFYEEDLKECGIDVKDASVCSGVCTQIFREEFGLYLGKVYSFVHLTIQEFIAALYVFLCFFKQTGHVNMFRSTLTDLLKSEVDKALKSENGHLDLFLRFLLGLSLESNHTLLRGLLKKTRNRPLNRQEIVEYIKMKIRDNSSSEKSINLFHCLNELNDHSLVKEVQTYLSRTGTSCLSTVTLSPSQWSALVFVLLNSEKKLDEFKLSKYHNSEECLLRLLPVIKASSKADVSGCNLTAESCSALAPVLSSNSSSLMDLDMSYNKLHDSGVKLLSTGLKDPNCNLKTLQLEDCSIGEKGCSALLSALRSNPSHLIELNLGYNKLGDKGVKLLCCLLQDPCCQLKTLRLPSCSIGEEGCSALALVLKSKPSHLRELNLGCNEPGELGLKLLSDLLQEPQCQMETLILSNCSIGEKACTVLVSALKLNPSHLKELNLNYNELRDSGVKLLADLLQDPNCKLESLHVSRCNLTERSCSALASVLSSKSSSLTKLNLSYSSLQDSGVKTLCAGLKDHHCKLQTLQLCNCSIGERGCAALASALRSNPSQLRELDLNYNKLQDSGVKLLSVLLQDQHCKLEKLQMYNCSIGEEGCAALISALRSSTSQLKELSLGCNKLGDTELKRLNDLLEDPHCELKILDIFSSPLISPNVKHQH
ncbi:NACHT, LRR and PYD domains-containing protein 12-like isoform X2 [Puntigrus tetrazona]|uniref:NACHT, LRR and PYD domains-containing protein 12-like isoform X2 n=1 Tax=Puntigrus tetrazona TaxID=1606681 RepID=UPI001C89AF79|nr:NACHT, LRR and PYD domains-containing protein 12-like isoform X2 [Puntigrus tetrazona]